MKSDGNDGSAVVSEGASAPVPGRPAPRKRTSTLQGGAAPPVDDVPSLSTSADAPPSLEALDSALGFTQPASSPARSSDLAPRSTPDGASRAGTPLSAPSAPPRPRTTSAPPGSAAASSANPTPPPRPGPPLAGTDGPPPIPDIDGPTDAAATRDSSSPGGSSRRRSRRTLKIPDDAVPSTTPAPPAVSAQVPSATPVPSGAPATPTPVSSTLPAVLAPPSSPPAAPQAPVPPSASGESVASSPVQPRMERQPIVTDDSIAIIRPIAILAIGDPTPIAPVAAPPAPAAVAPIAPVAAAAAETTMPSAPSPLAAARSAQPAPAVAAQAGPTITVSEDEPSTDEVDALEEIEPDRESAPASDEAVTAAAGRAASKADEVDALEELDADADQDRISGDEIEIDRAVTEEIPVVMEVEPEQPKRPPPPPKRAPDSARMPETAATEAARAEPAPASAPAPAGPPPSAPASKPASSKPTPPVSKAESKKRPWWDEIFSEDFIRTMDQPKPSFVQREVNFIEESLGVEKGAVVLDLACGTGQHAVELASRGYSVVGFDLSLAMLARASDEAQERGQKLNFLQGDMREMAFEEMFDGIYCWATSFGYFDEEKNLEVLARAHRALRHGGMLLIDIVNRDFIAPRQPSLVWFEGEGCVCMDEMHVDFFTSRLKVKRTVMFEDGRTREVDYSIRLYNLHELGKMMHDCGFRVVQVTGQPAHPGVFFGSESPRIIVLAERAD